MQPLLDDTRRPGRDLGGAAKGEPKDGGAAAAPQRAAGVSLKGDTCETSECRGEATEEMHDMLRLPIGSRSQRTPLPLPAAEVGLKAERLRPPLTLLGGSPTNAGDAATVPTQAGTTAGPGAVATWAAMGEREIVVVVAS
mmetsp:Transcript_95700/g.239785  ORF Transcript_95700/g.239785 Transcript_95700/m.239785 type:complete len:140 (+) Transcript_95700:422-841(+)